jgi:hypothetical protein
MPLAIPFALAAFPTLRVHRFRLRSLGFGYLAAQDERRAEMTTLLKCLACGEIQALGDGRTVCKCGRSAARLDGAIVEVQGPARVLVPADDVMTVDGIPWTAMPEEPVVVRRAA